MAPAGASTQYEASVKFGWTITASFVAHVDVNYATGQAAFAQGSNVIQQSASGGSGTCTTTPPGDTYTSYTLTYGAIKPGTGNTGCNYQNAIGISILTNDSNGFTVLESLGVTTTPTNHAICVFPDSTTLSTTTPASINGTAPAAATGAVGGTLTCAGTGVQLANAPGTIVAGNSLGYDVTGPIGTNNPTGPYTTTTPSASQVFGAAAITPASTTTTYFLGEDVQLIIPSNAASGTFSDFVILYFIPQ